jgi:hypothetical protein
MRTGCSLSALLLLGLSLCACSTGPVSAKTSPQRARQLIVLIDLSASRSIAMESDAKTFLHQLVDQLTFGDELVLLEVQESGLSDHPELWKGKMPVLLDPSYVSAHDKAHLRAAQGGWWLPLTASSSP